MNVAKLCDFVRCDLFGSGESNRAETRIFQRRKQTSGVLHGGFNKNVHVIGCARHTMNSRGHTACHQIFHLMGVQALEYALVSVQHEVCFPRYVG